VNTAGEERRVVFFSAEPNSVGHIYRVENTVAALAACGWMAEWAPLADSAAHEKVDAADVVAVFRAGWDGDFSEVRRRCDERGIPLVYDTDDLIFDPVLAAGGALGLFDTLGATERGVWMKRIESYRRALADADCATVTTEPLALAAGKICQSVFVIPNALGPGMRGWVAAASMIPKTSSEDGRVRLLFASGTPTHQRDFRVAAVAVERIFTRHPGPLLTILGELDLAGFPGLAPYSHRIETRPRVPLSRLFEEIARADINLCPLELGNPFCEAKSAVRCLAASAIGVPSIVSPTIPLLGAVDRGAAGLVAGTSADWEEALERLILDEDFRVETGHRASLWERDTGDFPRWCGKVSNVFHEITMGK